MKVTLAFSVYKIATSIRVPLPIFIHWFSSCSWPFRGQYPGHVITLEQSKASISPPGYVLFLILSHRAMSVGRGPSLLHCSPCSRFDDLDKKFIGLSSKSLGGHSGPIQGWNFCILYRRLVACLHFPPLPRCYCIPLHRVSCVTRAEYFAMTKWIKQDAQRSLSELCLSRNTYLPIICIFSVLQNIHFCLYCLCLVTIHRNHVCPGSANQRPASRSRDHSQLLRAQ